MLTRATDNPDAALGGLFDNAAADELLSRRGLRTPFLRVAKNGRTYPATEFTAPGGVGAEVGDQVSDTRLTELFADGATLVLQALHRTWEPIREFAAALAADLGHPVQVNAYVTPAQSTGFSDHYDIHDVFVVQVAGTKTWRVRPPVLEAPLRSQPWDERRAQVEAAAAMAPLLETTLHPGDTLYLPRGFIHAATACGGVTTHLTIGVHTWTGHHLAEQLISYAARQLAADPAVRASLPAGIDLAGSAAASDPAVCAAAEQARAALLAAIAAAPVAAVLEPLAAAHRRGTRAAPLGPIAAVTAGAALVEDTRVEVRRHLAPALHERAGELVLESRAGRRVVRGEEAAGVRALLDRGAATAGELGLDLARRLVHAGVAVVAESPRPGPECSVRDGT